MKKYIIPVIVGLLAIAYLAEKFQSPCFEIPQTTYDAHPMMLDKCTGASWLLVRTTLIDDNNKPTGETTYRWSPLNRNSEEPLLTRTK